MILLFLIHEADPQSLPIVIVVFAHVVRPSVHKFQVKTMFATSETLGLAEWIIDDTLSCYFLPTSRLNFNSRQKVNPAPFYAFLNRLNQKLSEIYKRKIKNRSLN